MLNSVLIILLAVNIADRRSHHRFATSDSNHIIAFHLLCAFTIQFTGCCYFFCRNFIAAFIPFLFIHQFTINGTRMTIELSLIGVLRHYFFQFGRDHFVQLSVFREFIRKCNDGFSGE